MKRWIAILVAISSLGWLGRAQVTVDLTLDQYQFLTSESLPVKVKIQNSSGQTIRFGTRNDWLVFSVEDIRGRAVSRTGDVPVEGAFDLESAERAKFDVNIAPYFDLQNPGTYRVTVQMAIPTTGEIVTSAPVTFDIIHGTRLWEQEFGVPGSGDAARPPERRKYMLQQSNHTKQLRLYVRIMDAKESRTVAIFPAGAMTSLSRPQPLIDKDGKLHLLHQYGQKSYTYHVVDPDGRVLVRQTWEIGSSRPELRMNDDSEVLVIGGVRRMTSADVPPKPKKAATTPDDSKPKPATAANPPTKP